MSERASLFDVRSEWDQATKKWHVQITTNGYQWHSLPIGIADHQLAGEIAAYLRVNLEGDAESDYAESIRMLRGE